MTLKAFQELVEKKSGDSYEEWFERLAKHEICVGTVYIRCVKLSKSRVAFRDTTVYKVQPENTIREFNEDADKLKQRVIRMFDSLDVMNRLALREYLDLLVTKDEMEKELKKIEEYPEGTVYCSFCGKQQAEAKRLIAARNKVFICDECIEICNEIMEEELEDDERFTKEDNKS